MKKIKSVGNRASCSRYHLQHYASCGMKLWSVPYRGRNIVMIMIIPIFYSFLNTCTRLNVGISSVGAQVGQENGPPPLLASNGKIIRRRDDRNKNYYIKTKPPKSSNPRFTHSIIISGANIVNLPVPGVGRDHIK